MGAIDGSLDRSCESVPGLVHGALVLLPEGLLIGTTGSGSALDNEPLVRATMRCLGGAGSPVVDCSPSDFVEYMLVVDDHFAVVQRVRGNPRFALALLCTRSVNMAMVLRATRDAVEALEATVDLGALGYAGE